MPAKVSIQQALRDGFAPSVWLISALVAMQTCGLQQQPSQQGPTFRLLIVMRVPRTATTTSDADSTSLTILQTTLPRNLPAANKQ